MANYKVLVFLLAFYDLSSPLVYYPTNQYSGKQPVLLHFFSVIKNTQSWLGPVDFLHYFNNVAYPVWIQDELANIKMKGQSTTRDGKMHLFQCGNNFSVLMEDLTGDRYGLKFFQGL